MTSPTPVATMVEELISDAKRELNLVGRRYAAELEKLQGITDRMASAADYGYGIHSSELTDCAQKVALHHQQSKSLQNHIAGLEQTLKAAQSSK